MNLSSKAVEAAQSILSSEAGLKVSVENLQEQEGRLLVEPPFDISNNFWQAKLTERIPSDRSPKISVALVKISRGQKEKLVDFSAVATLQFELVSTLERADLLQTQVSDFVDALCDVLNRNQGLWSKGVYFAGGFTAEISPVTKGGLNYVQSATITFETHLWQD